MKTTTTYMFKPMYEGGTSFVDPIRFFCVHHSLVATCWERADLLAHLCVMFSFVLSLSHMLSSVRCGN